MTSAWTSEMQMLDSDDNDNVSLGVSLRGVNSIPCFVWFTNAASFAVQKVHIAHVNIDGVVDLPRTREKWTGKKDEDFLKPSAIADTYWALHEQDSSAWTHELDLRPANEKW